MSYGDYVEQLTYLLFLKMAEERSHPPHSQPSSMLAAYAWPAARQRRRCAVRLLPAHAGTARRAAGHAGAGLCDAVACRESTASPSWRTVVSLIPHSCCHR
ncbi:MAG: hypothetical protein V5B60_05895 [Accumulibacter sp.]|uniref:hypothetical protein n=1 Tax=Accumulibacter sp. TaxID=2053492 RepID=UPI002FC28550